MTYKSTNRVRFSFSVWRNGAYVKNLDPYSGGTLTHDNNSELQDSVQAVFYACDGVNFLTDELRVECDVNGETYPLGQYVVPTARPYKSGGVRVIEIEAYSLLWRLKQAKLENIVTYAQGTRYVEIINGLLADAGFLDYEIEDSALTLATDREDWQIGTDYLTIANDLLREMNYNPLYVDYSGKVRATRYVPPTLSGVTHIYGEGKNSVISADYQIETDNFDKCNVFIVICDNPDLSSTMRAVSVNDDPYNPWSTVSLGRRIPHIEWLNNTPSQAELQNYADNLRAKSYETTERIEITTAIMPDHTANETLLVQVGDIAGVYRETGFEIALSGDGQMKHKGVRVIV